ncbi:MAG: pseudouridine synthase [Planctomycetota bacterium]
MSRGAKDAVPEGDSGHLVRLNKLLADHGIASRRQADLLIAAGKVSVDGEPATELGLRVDPERQKVEIDGVVLKPRGARRRYYLLNKPSGVVCTNEPRETRPRAVDLITDVRKGRIYTVGRLDEDSVGLILLTNDGEFANRIMHPRYGVQKTYVVKVRGEIDDAALQKVREGVQLSEGRTAGARILVERRGREHSLLTVTIREGMNREIRRTFAKVGYKVLELRRTRIGPVTDRRLKTGRWRELEAKEVQALLAGESEPDVSARRRAPSRGKKGRSERHPNPHAFAPRPAGSGPGAPRSFGSRTRGPRSESPRGSGPRRSGPFPRPRKS